MLILMLFISANALAQFTVITYSPRADTLSASDLRLIFSKQRTFWADGQPILVFILPPNSNKHQDFCRNNLKIMPYFLQQKWDKRVFSGTGERPVIVSNETDMWQKVHATPGAIGYISTDFQVQGGVNAFP
ncbi:hypothetical protein KU855_00070 [Shewanella sp. NIFS-20-20]|nr:hypothetical protein [Shewanella sp. NIFS-20-20]